MHSDLLVIACCFCQLTFMQYVRLIYSGAGTKI